MKSICQIALIILISCSISSAFAEDVNLKTYSSDMVGMKLDHPSGWMVDEYSWGFMLMDPVTTATVTCQAYFMPKKYEKAYDVNMNEEFELIYGDMFESVEEGEKEIAGKTWDYTVSRGGKGTPMAYVETTYSILVENTVYSIEVFYLANTPEDVVERLNTIVDTVRLMYKESELPIIRRYKKEWEKAKENNEMLEYVNPDGDIKVSYATPWLFVGGGVHTEASFHYLKGEPFADIDVLVVKTDATDTKEAVAKIQNIIAMMTSSFTSVGEGTKRLPFRKYYIKTLTQGEGEHTLYTRFYAVRHKEGTTLFIFANHQKANDYALDLIEEFMGNLALMR